MPTTTTDLDARARRADAQRSIARVLDAALEELAHDTEASMAAIAARAGVARATLYAHYPTREALVAAVTQRAMAESRLAVDVAAPDEGEPREALARVLTSAWRKLGRYHPIVGLNARLEPEHACELHEPVAEMLRPLLERGQASGAFDPDLSMDWMLTVIRDLVHAASGAVRSGAMSEEEAEGALLTSVLGALGARG